MTNKRAVTLLEIMIAFILLAVVTGGLVNIFISSQRWLIRARSRMQGGELGKRFLDPLQMGARQDQWAADTGCLTSNGSACDTTAWIDHATNITYTPTYTVNAVAIDAQNPLGRLRRVRLGLTWGEYTPNP